MIFYWFLEHDDEFAALNGLHCQLISISVAHIEHMSQLGFVDIKYLDIKMMHCL